MDGYNSDNEVEQEQILIGGNKKKVYRKRGSTKKRRNALTSQHTLKRLIPKEYKNSIYYNTDKFDNITKHILDSDLLKDITEENDKTDTTMIDTEFNKITNNSINTENHNKINNPNTVKSISISVVKTNIDGKKSETAKIMVDNSKKSYVKEYTYINGVKKIRKIKK